jgi:EAL domain-containing protein (putative c-di-GMP-specific phosphodiesterase class I)/CHASE2 domain-containing sensor protein
MGRVGSFLARRDAPGPAGAMAHSPRRERMAHAIVASLLSLVAAAAMLLEPLDWMIWASQSRFGDAPASGEIVYLQADSTLTLPQADADRLELAAALDRLRATGVDRVYLDLVFPAGSRTSYADARLGAALDRWGEKAIVVDRIDVGTAGTRTEIRNSASFTKNRRRVWSGFSTSWPNFAWRLPFSYETSEGTSPSLAADLAGINRRSGTFEVEYRIRSYAIPAFPLRQVIASDAPDNLAGKIIVIGIPRDPALSELRVPGQMSAPPSFVAIHGAETLIRGAPRFVSGVTAMAVLAVLLVAGAFASSATLRRIAYGVAAAAPIYAGVVAATYGLRIELSYCLPLLAAFGILRWRSNWKQRIAQIDPDTGLPSFRALASQLDEPTRENAYIIVAKVHGYEAILKSLEAPHRASYMLKLAERIRVGDGRMRVYVDGHYLGWRVALPDEARLREHLEGLRAIFAAPVTVDARSIDVGITFGAAALREGQAQRCLADALAAVEETTEALEPIRIAQDAPDSDTLWDLSLRARIDAAMEAGEVFCVYQPKMDIAANRLIGVEALVRWEDPERGFIPPMHFVMQCEKAGRMEYLTRYVLQSACSAGKLLHFRGSRITMAVNISATLLNDMRIVGIVRNVLQATGFDPSYLVLEITETARIRDLTQARTVLKALKALGTHLSMDDFGVGSANFEALQALPFDEIKIDREFVSRASTSDKARAITASIVGLGASARIAVVAEGAETDSDLAMLREIGCWQVQGYALARPMALTNLLTFIDKSDDPAKANMV